jgi:hypothetical protein
MAKLPIAPGVLLALGLSLTTNTAAAETAESLTVFKSPWCGCCGGWIEIMQAEGYAVTVHDVEDLTPAKVRAGIPGELEACHTALLDDSGYVLEGHVPPVAVARLLAERPDVRGIALPGMPPGAPGMGEAPGARYTVYSYTDSAAALAVFLEIGE